MNDQRLYRGKRVDNGEWVYGYYVYAPQPRHSKHNHCIFDAKLYESGGESFAFCFRYVHPASVGQSTGRKDFTGKKAYDGDVVKSKHYGGKGVIGWHSNGWAVEVPDDTLLYSLNMTFTIITNTTDAPELLKEKEK